MLRQRRILATAAIIAVVVTALWFEPVRGLAGDFLDVFRVRRFKVISVTPQDMAQLEELLRRGGNADLANFGRVEVAGEASRRWVTAAQAEQTLGFPLRLPQHRLVSGYKEPEHHLEVMPSVTFALRAENINSFLRSLGSHDLLPPTLDGKTFTIKPYPICTSVYRRDSTSFSVVQGRTPELVMPAGVNAAEVRNALLLIPGLPENLRRQLESIEDWRHTLPVPGAQGQAREVTVAGSPGVFWTAPEQRPMPSALVWEHDGLLYGIQGSFTLAEAQDLASSMMRAR